MAEYTVNRLPPTGDAEIYEVRLADGTANRFIYSGAQQVGGGVSDEAFAHWVAISVKRAQRESDYRAQHGAMGEVA
jgi:hypothetical protein